VDNKNFDDFESGNVDTFDGQWIQDCNNKFISERLSAIKVNHSGSDAWGVDWIKVRVEPGRMMSLLICWSLMLQFDE